MKKVLCILAGVVLIIAGSGGLFAASTAQHPIGLPRVVMAAWKLAVVAYGILLVYLTFLNIAGYGIALNLSYSGNKPTPFSLLAIGNYLASVVGIVFQGLFLLCVAFLCIVLVSREQFNG